MRPITGLTVWIKEYAHVAVAALWVVAVIIHAFFFVNENVAYVRAHPEIEWYAGRYSFQVMNFCIARLPLWIAVYLVFYGAATLAKRFRLHRATRGK